MIQQTNGSIQFPESLARVERTPTTTIDSAGNEAPAETRLEPGDAATLPTQSQAPSAANREPEVDHQVSWKGWTAAALTSGILVTCNLLIGRGDLTSIYWLAGVTLSTLFWPVLMVSVYSLFSRKRNWRMRVKLFTFICGLTGMLSVVGLELERGYVRRWVGGQSLTSADFSEQAMKCSAAGDSYCAQVNWEDYVRLEPNDALGWSKLGITQSRRGRHAQAVESFDRAIQLGEGDPHLFALYSESLGRTGRTEDAITWGYKALAVAPATLEVRGKIARLLVTVSRPYEALSLLQAFDSEARAQGQPMRFEAQRLAIETAIDTAGKKGGYEVDGLRLPAYAGHFFAPVKLGEDRTSAFMVDTGATRMTVSEQALQQSKASYRVVDASASMITADGRKVTVKSIVIDSIRIGRVDLKNIEATTCPDCSPLLGQSVLSKFDLYSTREGGVEIMTLLRRAG